MKKIAALLTDDFEDSELSQPAAALTQAGHTLEYIGLVAGNTVKGKKEQTPVKIEKSVENVTADEYDALLIPGGYSPDKLRVNESAVRFVRDFVQSGKPILMICHAPQLLITADVLRGRTVTGYASIIQDIKNAGATYEDKEVVQDQNLISSRNPGDIPAFIETSIRILNE